MQKKSGIMKRGLDAMPLFLLDNLLSNNFSNIQKGKNINTFDELKLQYHFNVQPEIQIFNGLYLSITGITLYAISDAPPTG